MEIPIEYRVFGISWEKSLQTVEKNSHLFNNSDLIWLVQINASGNKIATLFI